MKTYKPQYYIKSNENTEKYECVICNFIAEKPYTCNGPCHQNFCFQCVNVIKGNRNECPFRCSQPFQLTQGKGVDLEFRCPFRSQECKILIPSIAAFYDHSNACKFLPEGWKDKEFNYLKYKCDKGHDLFFMDQKDLMRIYGYDEFFDAPVNSTCSSCGEKGLCRTICPGCSTQENYNLYCTTCRKPPCTKNTCLYEHQLIKQQCTSDNLFCDFCGTRACLLGPNAFRDVKCNFDICEACFINLPETHELVPFKMPKDAIKHLFKNGNNIFAGLNMQIYHQLLMPMIHSSSSSSQQVQQLQEPIIPQPIINMDEPGQEEGSEYQPMQEEP